jgi:hypothetical protein
MPGVSRVVLRHVGLTELQDLHPLATMKRLQHLEIAEEEPLCARFPLWRLYAIFRFRHLPLQSINGKPVTIMEEQRAAALFGSLEEIVQSVGHPRKEVLLG